MKILNPLEIPLTGTSLIEASAGTGKTHTITTLFIRLLLEKKVAIDQILIVTFTIAATEELRIKLCERLAEAVNGLSTESGVTDPALSELLRRHNRDEALSILMDAAARMDELSVYTIDAMCLRVLQDFAFESGLPMRMDFIANDFEIQKRVAEDYWRCVIGGEDKVSREVLGSRYEFPQNMLSDLAPVLQLRNAESVPDIDASELEAERKALSGRFNKIVAEWQNTREEVLAILTNADVLNQKTYNPSAVAKAVSGMDTICGIEELPMCMGDKFKLLTHSSLVGAVKKNKTRPEHRFFTICEGFDQELTNYARKRDALVVMAARDTISSSLQNTKRERGILHFEDLRERLDTVLQGNASEPLARKIRALWPYAMIDEFQDTDPQQYRIFSTVYSGHDECGFFQIGDPKQAIYSFRGADVFTYMMANSGEANRYTLGTNWRSASKLVAAVNSVFQHAEKPFVFDDQIKFRPVDAAGNADLTPLRVDEKAVVPMQFLMIEPDEANRKVFKSGLVKLERAPCEAQVAEACAGEIAALLSKGQAGSATLGDRNVRASDIAILVRTRSEGRIMQSALYSVGVRSASLSSEDVFASREAQELAIVMDAIARPSHSGLIRQALVTEMLGYNADSVVSLNESEQQWDQLFGRFLSYMELWRDRGIMTTLQTLITDMQVAKRVLSYADGERRLTNILQLAELLQLKSGELSSQDELIGYLREQFKSQGVDEEQLLRLESDENLVRIVTMHKSKGLEYPIVYLPFPWKIGESRNSKNSTVCQFHNRDSLKCVLDFGSAQLAHNRALQSEENLAENVRLLYVALTRAKHLCVLCWGNIIDGEKSAPGYLFHQEPGGSATPSQQNEKNKSRMKSLQPHEVVADIQALADQSDGCIAVLPLPGKGAFYNATAESRGLCLAPFSAKIERHWKITSYTGLLHGEDSGLPDHDSAATGVETETEIGDDAPGARDELGSIARLPAGTQTGQMIHDLLENMDFADENSVRQTVDLTLGRYGSFARRGDTEEASWTDVVLDIVNNTLDTVLETESGFRLRDLATEHRINELEFFFPLNGVDAKSLDAILCNESGYQHCMKGLSFSRLQGLMRGFIDMVARKDGRYFIVDYKSNLLGDVRENYQQSSLSGVIKSKRYDLQYLIYTVALHRFLKSRIRDYDYSRDFGGVYYLFVRGMRPGSRAGIWFDRPSPHLVNALDQGFDSK